MLMLWCLIFFLKVKIEYLSITITLSHLTNQHEHLHHYPLFVHHVNHLCEYSDCIIYPIHIDPLSHWHTTACGRLIFKRDHKSLAVQWHHWNSEWMTKKDNNNVFIAAKFRPDHCLIPSSVLCVNSERTHQWGSVSACQKPLNKSLSKRSRSHARYPLLVSKMFLKHPHHSTPCSQFLWDHALMMTLGSLLITICIALLTIIPLPCTILTLEAWDGFLSLLTAL